MEENKIEIITEPLTEKIPSLWKNLFWWVFVPTFIFFLFMYFAFAYSPEFSDKQSGFDDYLNTFLSDKYYEQVLNISNYYHSAFLKNYIQPNGSMSDFIKLFSLITDFMLILWILPKYKIRRFVRIILFIGLFVTLSICNHYLLPTLNSYMGDSELLNRFLILIPFFIVIFLTSYIETKSEKLKIYFINLFITLSSFFLYLYAFVQLILYPVVLIGIYVKNPSWEVDALLNGEQLFLTNFVLIIALIALVFFIRQFLIFFKNKKLNIYFFILLTIGGPLTGFSLNHISKQNPFQFNETVLDIPFKERHIELLKTLNGPVQYSSVIFNKDNKNNIFTESNSCILEKDQSLIHVGLRGNLKIEDSVNCEKLNTYWIKNKKDFHFGTFVDVIVQELSHYYIRNGNYTKGLDMLDESAILNFKFHKNTMIGNHASGIIPLLTHAVLIGKVAVLDNDLMKHFSIISQEKAANKNIYAMKRAGFFGNKNCKDLKKCFGKQRFDVKKEFFIDNLKYTEKELLSKKVFPTGIISGEIIVNGNPFNGIIELIRPKGSIDSALAFLGTIPVVNGKIKDSPIMVGKYILGIRLDNYINNKKINKDNTKNNVVIEQSDFENLYEITTKNLPEAFIVNDNDLEINLGKIEIMIKEKENKAER